MKILRLAIALAAPLLLASCLVVPGKFVSTLDIRKDRSFTFTYVGEVIAPDAVDAGAAGNPPSSVKPPPENAAARRAFAETLAKEVGYRSVQYLGDDRFQVDYVMSGKLDRSFAYPINLDAKAFIPWIAVEVRKDGTARVKALAFGDPADAIDAGPAPPTAERREGTFTLTTDAALVMQNNEEGLAPGSTTKIVWKVTPTSKTVPTAVVRF